ncbi:PAS domain S-box protein [bacterium]|nr:PAS domain S-box protein [bacterium]
MKKTWPLSQILLLSSIVIAIAAVVVSIIITNTTLRSVEKNLPSTLFKELISLDLVLEQISEVVAAAEVAAIRTSPQNIDRLKEEVEAAERRIKNLRQTYVFDNLIQASAFHAMVMPAISDLQTWLSEGVSGYDPTSLTTIQIVRSRISDTFHKAKKMNRQSRLHIQNQLDQERGRLDRFLYNVNLLFILTLIIIGFTIILFIRQHLFRIREMDAQRILQTQSDLLNSLFENIPQGVMLWDCDGLLIFANKTFTELTGYSSEDIKDRNSWFTKAYPDLEYRNRVAEDWEYSKDLTDAQREFEITCKNGQVKEIEFRGTFLPDGRSLITLADLTNRKLDEKRLHYFRTAVEYSSDAIGMSDPTGKHWYQNKSFNELFGDIGQDPPASAYVDEKVGREIFETIMAGGQWTGEVEMHSRKGNILNILLRAYAIKNEQNQIIGLVGTHTDMTLQKQAEKALLESEQKYRAVVENTPDLLYRTDLNGIITFMSSSVYRLSGYTVQEAIGMKMAEEVYAFPEERHAFMEELKKQGAVKNFQAGLKRKDGSIWWASTNAHFFKDKNGNIAGVEGITRDITDTKQAEAALKQSEERFKMAGKVSYDLIYEWDVKTDSLVWFGDIDTLLGFEKGEISSNIAAWLDLIHSDDLPKLENAVEHHRTATNPIHYEYRIKRKDGSWRYWADNALPLLDEAGLPFKWVGVCTDITSRKQSEQALRESEQRMRAILEASPDPMVMYNKDGHPLFVNPAFIEVFGWTMEELRGRLIPFVPEDQKTKTSERIKEIYIQGKPVKFETKRFAKDGRILDILLSAAVAKGNDDEPTGMVVILADITERKALEAQFEQAQKMESIGTLAGGIAHDFNNLLGGIFGYLDIARKKEKDPEIAEYLNKAFSASERAEGLTHQLLTFSKGGAPIKKVGPLVPFLQETAHFALSGSNVSCSFDIPDDLWMCDFDKNQIGQVIDNIIINAHHAMPSGGKIQISAVNVILQENEQVGLKPGNYVKISISDSGTGIPEKYISKIFDPFFTTKQKGSGLGLATGYSIIKKHDGIITVDSKPGVGSTFFIFIPASEIQKTEASAIYQKSYQGSGNILVMDDDEILKRMMVDMLEDMGFTPFITDEGQQALDEFKRSKEQGTPYQAVILDLTIRGGMGGKETVKEIRKIDANIPVFVASGYSEDDAIANPEEYGFTDSLKKPFGIDQLAEILEKYL